MTILKRISLFLYNHKQCVRVHSSSHSLTKGVSNTWIYFLQSNEWESGCQCSFIVLIPKSLIISEVDDFLNTFERFLMFSSWEFSIMSLAQFEEMGLWSILPHLLVMFRPCISIFINLLRLWFVTWLMLYLENVPCILKKNEYSVAVECNVLHMSVRCS